MKRKLQIIISCIMTVFLTLGLLYGLMGLVERKDSVEKYADFYGQEQPFDVLFFGSSHMWDGVFPLDMWDDYGIVSYNMGTAAMRIPGSYWTMRLVTEQKKPKLVVLDTYMVWQDVKATKKAWANMHKTMDVLPLSKTKMEATYDLMNDIDEERSDERKAEEMLFDFSLYHSRWAELTQADFDVEGGYEKGASGKIAVNTKAKFTKLEEQSVMPFDSGNLEYLCKFIEYCKENDIEVLLTTIPYPANEKRQAQYAYLNQIADRYGIGYLNFLDLDVVDYSTDNFDKGSHLNLSGARKVTDYLGQYIMENYDVTDKRDDAEYKGWNEDYREYIGRKAEQFVKQKTLNSYLMMMYDNDFDYILNVDYKSKQIDDETVAALFSNLGIDSGKISADSDMITLSCPEKEPQVEYLSVDKLSAYGIEPDIFENCPGDVNILVLDKATGEIVDVASFVGGRKKHVI